MFICSICGLPAEKCERQTKEVIETREKNYYTVCIKREVNSKKLRRLNLKRFEYKYFHTPSPELTQELKELTKNKSKTKRWILVSEKHSTGNEIVQENNVCSNCAKIVGAK